MVLLLTTTALALTGCTATGVHATPRSPEPSATSVPVAQRFAILDRAFSERDALPEGVTETDDVVLNSQRYTGEHDGTRYWIAAQSNGGACLIAWNPSTDSAENYSVCGGTPVPAATVVVSMLDEDERPTSLASDGYTGAGSKPLHEIAPNVWSR